MKFGKMAWAALPLVLSIAAWAPPAAADRGDDNDHDRGHDRDVSAATIAARQRFFGEENVDPRRGDVRNDRVIFSWTTNASLAVSLKGRIILLDTYINRPELPPAAGAARSAPLADQRAGVHRPAPGSDLPRPWAWRPRRQRRLHREDGEYPDLQHARDLRRDAGGRAAHVQRPEPRQWRGQDHPGRQAGDLHPDRVARLGAGHRGRACDTSSSRSPASSPSSTSTPARCRRIRTFPSSPSTTIPIRASRASIRPRPA